MAIVFTDLVGSVELCQQLGDARMFAFLKRHFSAVTSIVEECGGRVVKTIGDSVMAAFDVPEDAARAAIHAVLSIRELRSDDALLADVHIRAGCHIGPCLAVTNSSGQIDYFGNSVNIAARAEGIAKGDEVVLSPQVARTTNVTQLMKKIQDIPGVLIKRDMVELKGVGEKMECTRIQVDSSFAELSAALSSA